MGTRLKGRGAKSPSQEARPVLVVDAMLGRLARWLRVLGYDTWFQGDIDDDDLIRIAREAKGIIITRDTRLLERTGIGPACFVSHDRVEDQIIEIAEILGIEANPERLFTRCLRCNGSIESVEREEVNGEVPDYVRRTHHSFSQCSSCGRIYWGGSHRTRMIAKLRDLGLLKDESEPIHRLCR